MLVQVGKKYLFMTQRYVYTGTVVQVTPTHVLLGMDAQIHYDDVGPLEQWAKGDYKQGGAVPGQVVGMLGTDATPIGWIVP